MKIVWVVPEIHGGIQTYAKVLWPDIKAACSSRGIDIFDPLYLNAKDFTETLKKLKEIDPDIIHIQHEYKLFGRKVPGLYKFPSWIKKFRQEVPKAKIIATAHTVLDEHYRFAVRWRGLQAPLRWLANLLLLPFLKQTWLEKTWKGLDGVIVHSEYQMPLVRSSGCENVIAIPHFVPVAPKDSKSSAKYFEKIPSKDPSILVFGFISSEKGQDIAIEALSKISTPAVLVVAGGARRATDLVYRRHCQQLIEKHNLSSRVFFPGFVPEEIISGVYERATVVLAPFRETWGSGTLVQALARGKPVLASNLKLNLELGERVPGCLEYFESANAEECSRKLDELLKDEVGRKRLSENALRYAEKFSTEKVASLHVDFYKSLFL